MTDEPRRRGIRFFDKAAARPLHETGIMSMPTTEGDVDGQMMEWALCGGHIVNVLNQDVSSFDMRITESLGGWDRIVDTVRERSDGWKEAAADV